VNGQAFAADVKTQIRRLGGTFMKSEQAHRDARLLGLADFPYYFAGRGGVLGDIGPDALAALFPFFPAELVRAGWRTGRCRLPPHQAGLRYAETCQSWARARLAGFAGAERLAELLATVADGAASSGLPLFAGWRAVPLPADPPGRVVQLAHVLREHRGGLHAIAVAAAGLTPLQATLARDRGQTRAQFLRWTQPYPEITDGVRKRRAAAEELTDQLAAPAYAVLGNTQAAELRKLVGQAYRRAVLAER
jgi:hypothetical protein